MPGFAARFLFLNLGRDAHPWIDAHIQSARCPAARVDLHELTAGSEKKPFMKSFGTNIQGFDGACLCHR